MSTSLPRNKVKKNETWNSESVFATPEAFESELKNFVESLPAIKKFQGHLSEKPDNLIEAMSVLEKLQTRANKIRVYANMSHSVNTADQNAAAMNGKAVSALAQLRAAASFIDPELLSLGKDKLGKWIKNNPRLNLYAHYVDDLFRKQAHVRSAEVEEILGMLQDPFRGAAGTAGMLANADFKFKAARDSKGKQIDLTQSTHDRMMGSPDRKTRQTAWENYRDKYLEYKNTLASNLGTSIKQNVFNMRARKFESSLESTLYDHNIPVEVFHNLINSFKKHLPLWHRYWEIRRKALGVKVLQPYDVWAPLSKKKVSVPFEQAVDWICEGLAPMGDDYVRLMRKGCLEDRWVDRSPNVGKRQGAFSNRSTPDMHPFILMSYNDNVSSLSTLAHELGHSMHGYLSCRAQPMIYTQYSSIVAETASNFHQVMTRAHLLNNNNDKNFQINVLEEAMGNFHRYFFIMPTLARFELETHQRIEKGQALTADSMIELMADLFSEGYGGKMNVDRQRVGITWGTFTTHMYIDYYSFQYSIGISAAHALGKRILDHQPNAVEDYLNFLKAGSSIYGIELFKQAGVDMTTTQPVEDTFAILEGYVDRLEKLTSK